VGSREVRQSPVRKGDFRRGQRRHDPERVRNSVESLGRLLRDHDWRWSRQSQELLRRLQRGAEQPSASVGQVAQRPSREALDEAQELIYQAWEKTGKKREALARAALEVCRDCADAYLLLGDAAPSQEEACRLYRRGVEAGERVLGLDAFVRYAGRFWQVLETRPYMRAKLNLGDCLHRQGEFEEAARHFADLIQLDPNDNQGVRYWYSLCLLAMGDDAGLERLLERFSWDLTAPWTYTGALQTYRTKGPARAAGALRRALDSNPFVPDFLLGLKPIPEEIPDVMTIGGEAEAAAVADALVEAWEDTPGALAWLREAAHERDEQARGA